MVKQVGSVATMWHGDSRHGHGGGRVPMA